MKKLNSLSKGFINYCQFSKNLSNHSIHAYRNDIDDFLLFVGYQTKIKQIKAKRIEQFARYLKEERNLSSRSIKRKIACLSVFFNWMQKDKIIKNNPVLKARILLKYPKLLPKVISKQDLTALIQYQKSEANKGLKNNQDKTTLIAIVLMVCTGIRVGELVKIQLSDIHSCASKIKIQGKGSRERYVYITNPSFLSLFREYICIRKRLAQQNQNLFLNSRGTAMTEQIIRIRFAKISESLLGKRITPHMFRHTAATMLIENGVDIRFVQKLLGHQSISTTEIYTHVSDQSLVNALFSANHLTSVI